MTSTETKASATVAPSSTVATLGASTSEERPGASTTRPPCCQSMTASDSTPSSGESASGVVHDQRREMFLRLLETNADVVNDMLRVRADDGPEEIVRDLREAAALTQLLADMAVRELKGEAGDGGATTQ